MSYNPEIKEEKLREKKNYIQTCCSTSKEWVKVKEQFEKEKILILSVGYD